MNKILRDKEWEKTISSHKYVLKSTEGLECPLRIGAGND